MAYYSMNPSDKNEPLGRPTPETYENLDLLRAFAVLLVAGAHLSYELPISPRLSFFFRSCSLFGVAIFFVHTCMVLLCSMERTKTSHLVANFYIRRAFRIFPLCWVCIAFALATGLADAPREALAAMGWRGVLTNLALLQNYIPFPSIVGPLWSLPWEVQMYLVLPPLYILLKKHKRVTLPVALWLGATSLAIGATAIHIPHLRRAVFPPMFIGGMLAFQLRSKIRPIFSSVGWPALLVAITLSQYCFLKVSLPNVLGPPRNVLTYATACLVLGFAIPAFRQIRALWVAYPSHLIAKYSYGIYLFHVPCLELAFRHMPVLSLPLRILVFIGATVCLSGLSYHLIESPLIDLGKRLAKRLDSANSPILHAQTGATAVTALESRELDALS